MGEGGLPHRAQMKVANTPLSLVILLGVLLVGVIIYWSTNMELNHQ
jgi:CHASE2 domain-containing sensor protein